MIQCRNIYQMNGSQKLQGGLHLPHSSSSCAGGHSQVIVEGSAFCCVLVCSGISGRRWHRSYHDFNKTKHFIRRVQSKTMTVSLIFPSFICRYIQLLVDANKTVLSLFIMLCKIKFLWLPKSTFTLFNFCLFGFVCCSLDTFLFD